MTEFIVLFLFVMVGAVILGEMKGRKIKKERKGLEANLNKIDDFNPTQTFIGANASNGVSIDENRKKLCLIEKESANSNEVFKVVDYRDVLASEIYEDGKTITSTSRTSQLGGVLIGGLVLGGVGAIIGGLSGKTTTEKGKIKSLILKITINDLTKPVYEIDFIMGDMEVNKDSEIFYKPAKEKASHWYSLIEILIHRADEEDRNNALPKKENSVADELEKLAQLKEKGILSHEEFQEQKHKLLK